MNAIVSVGGKQYNVKAGDKILVEKIDKKSGEEFVLENVLFVKKDDNEVIVGKPLVKDAKVITEVKGDIAGPKVIVFRKRSKKGYRKKTGHKQKLTELFIKDIKIGNS